MATWKKVLIAVLAVVLVGVMVAASLLSKKKTTGEEVYIAKAGKKDVVTSVTGTGKIEPLTKVNVQSSVIGEIKKLPVKEGDTIKKGSLLVQINPDRYQSEVDRLEASVRMTRIAIDQERVQLENNRRILHRQEGLNRDGNVSPEILERAQLEVRMSEINLDSLQEQVTQATAALAKAKDELSKTTILSPMDGLITQLNAEKGEITLTGTMNNPGTVIMVVSDMSEVLAEVNVDETRIVKVKPGQPARVVVDAVGELHPYEGVVTEIAGTAVQRAGQQVQVFPVKVALTNPDTRLRPGMTAKARIEAERSGETVTIPIQAVLLKPTEEFDKAVAARAKKKDEAAPPAGLKDGKREVVYQVVDGKAVLVPVRSGISDETSVAILEGIKEGDQVITGPYRTVKKLKDGQAVKEKSGTAPKEGDDADKEKKENADGDAF